MTIGDIAYMTLRRSDGLVLKDGYATRRKYVVIVGFTSEGNAVGALLINSHIAWIKSSGELLDYQYPIKRTSYVEFLDYDSWIDCSELFEIQSDRIKDESIVGHLIDEDLSYVMECLKECPFIGNTEKKMFGLIK